MSSAKHWVCLGKVGRAKGLQGAFYVGGRRESLPPLSRLGVGGSDAPLHEYPIHSQSAVNGKPLLSLKGVVDRTAIEKFTGQKIWALKNELAIDEDNEFLLDDLLGVDVLGTSGKKIGKVVEVYDHGASINVAVLSPQGQRVDLPFVEQWFQLDFQSIPKHLSLVVEEECYADLWYTP